MNFSLPEIGRIERLMTPGNFQCRQLAVVLCKQRPKHLLRTLNIQKNFSLSEAANILRGNRLQLHQSSIRSRNAFILENFEVSAVLRRRSSLFILVSLKALTQHEATKQF